jgi:hypothetical protein
MKQIKLYRSTTTMFANAVNAVLEAQLWAEENDINSLTGDAKAYMECLVAECEEFIAQVRRKREE